MATKLYVGNLSFDTSDDELRQFFEQAGEVQSASVITDRATGRSKGFGFVEMSTEEGSKNAISQLNGQSLGSRTIRVEEAKPPTGGGGGRGGGGGYSRDRW